MEKAAVYNELHNGTATFGPTIFSDLSAEEFASKYLSKFPETPEIHVNETIRPTAAIPDSKNWVTELKVTPVRNQGDCGSCWSFTALAEVESQLLIKKSATYSLSTQQLVDCDPYDGGCTGGWMYNAWKYLATTGIMNEVDYPYKAKKGTCLFNSNKVAARLSSGSTLYVGKTPTDIYSMLNSHGPLGAALDASPLQNYQSGIITLNTAYCSSLSHAVLLVGYNVPSSYLLVKNSWGTYWGEKGYFRINPTSCLINNYVMGSNI